MAGIGLVQLPGPAAGGDVEFPLTAIVTKTPRGDVIVMVMVGASARSSQGSTRGHLTPAAKMLWLE